MGDFEDIQRLIRLKRHEKPPEGFMDDFMRAFQQRQRAELLKSSARGLLWERMATYFEGLLTPKYAWGAATAAVIALGIVSLNSSSSSPSTGGGDQTLTASQSHSQTKALGARDATYVATTGMPITDEEAMEYLLSRHYEGLFDGRSRDSLRQNPTPAIDSPQFAQPFNTHADHLLPVGFTLEMPR